MTDERTCAKAKLTSHTDWTWDTDCSYPFSCTFHHVRVNHVHFLEMRWFPRIKIIFFNEISLSLFPLEKWTSGAENECWRGSEERKKKKTQPTIEALQPSDLTWERERERKERESKREREGEPRERERKTQQSPSAAPPAGTAPEQASLRRRAMKEWWHQRVLASFLSKTKKTFKKLFIWICYFFSI